LNWSIWKILFSNWSTKTLQSICSETLTAIYINIFTILHVLTMSSIINNCDQKFNSNEYDNIIDDGLNFLFSSINIVEDTDAPE